MRYLVVVDAMKMLDKFERPLRDLRISVTDRCNFRCRYCMPAEIFGADYVFLPKEDILRFGEIEQMARLLVGLGVQKLRLTGGEPLLRRELHVLVEMLRKIEGVEDIAMTTNGTRLIQHAAALKEAGLDRVTVSLAAIDAEIFAQMNGIGAKPYRIIKGIDEALKVGLGVKINVVVQKAVNESEVIPMVQLARERKIPVRFIEFMDTGTTNQWKLDQVVPSAELLARIQQEVALVPIAAKHVGETATRYGVEGEDGFEVGFISSVTKPFCQACNRMRLSADGKLYACLFAADGLDVKEAIRSGEWEALESRVQEFWGKRDARYSMLRAEGVTQDKPEMYYIGG